MLMVEELMKVAVLGSVDRVSQGNIVEVQELSVA
jgi:hypothetical protein